MKRNGKNVYNGSRLEHTHKKKRKRTFETDTEGRSLNGISNEIRYNNRNHEF